MRRPVEPSTQLIFLQVAFLSQASPKQLLAAAPTSLHSCLVEIFTAETIQQCSSGIIRVKTVTSASPPPPYLALAFLHCVSSNFLHCGLSNVSSLALAPQAAHGSAGRGGSWKVAVGCALVKLIQEPRLEPALLLNRKTIRNEKCANCRWFECRR